jgi:Pentapeptide repeats (9 copies)
MYALESLAQDNPSRRQTIVDVLCAYLRMPYTPSPPGESAGDDGNDAPTGMTEPATAGVPRYDPAQELQVRQTAQRLLADHLRCPPDISHEDAQRIKASPEEIFWPGISLDLTGATLVDLDLSGVSVIRADFGRARFSGATSFKGAAFPSLAWFHRATFTGDARFDGATFSDLAWFHRATFTGDAGFNGATFSGPAGFGGATFSRNAWFQGATFSGRVSFSGATFSDDAGFHRVYVLHLEVPYLHADSVWPEGWTVRPDADDSSRGTLVPVATGADNN